MTSPQMAWLASTLAAASLGGACGNLGDTGDPPTGNDCACTEEFRTFTLTVVDEFIVPVSDVTLTEIIVRTGEHIGFLNPEVAPGVYKILDDSFKDRISQSGDRIRVNGSKSGVGVFQTDFVFDTGLCRCHVNKVSGPDTAVIF